MIPVHKVIIIHNLVVHNYVQYMIIKIINFDMTNNVPTKIN